MAPATYHPVFTPPPDPNVKIWRYMDFAKYVSFLDEQGLWFSRSDLLGDPFEGSISQASIMAVRRALSLAEIPSAGIDKMMGASARLAKRQRQYAYVNSWHINERESAAMWELYASSKEAIAIQSTYKLLQGSLPSEIRVREVVPADAECADFGQTEVGTDEDGNRIVERTAEVYLGLVHYIDYGVEQIPSSNAFYPYVYKRKSFEHERELRAVIANLPLLEPPSEDEVEYHPHGIPNLAEGQMVRVSIEELVEAVYIAPTAPDYFYKVVESVTRLYGFAHKPVIRSSLAEDPVF